MTEKVKVTQEQFDWLEKYKTEQQIDYAIDIQLHRKRPDSPIADWKSSEVARALYVGYEVEPEPLKINDWVTEHAGEGYRTGEIIGFTNKGRFVRFLNFDTNEYYFESMHSVQFEKSTPEEIAEEKERRKWAKIKEGDVLRKIPMAHEVAIYEGDADDESILVRNESGQHLWRKSQVELYAKKVGGK